MKYVLLAAALCASAGAASRPIDPSARRQIDAAVSSFMKRTGAPGVSIAIVVHGKTLFETGYGLADVENNVPATADTMYRLGSVSKPLTAVAIMQLVERGKIDLDAQVQRYCPQFPHKSAGPITSRELLGHLAGIRHYRADGSDYANTRHFGTITAALAMFENDPLVSEPGRDYHYSTYGYTLLGCVLEGAAGETYTRYMREHVFISAGMEATRDDDVYAVIPHRARGYQKKGGSIENADVADTSYKIPGGGLLSSAAEMARFEAALLNGRELRPHTRDVMWTPQHPADGKPDGYALGWSRDAQPHGAPEIVGHNGAQQGFNTAILLEPREKLGVVVLCNLEHSGPVALAHALLKVAEQLR